MTGSPTSEEREVLLHAVCHEVRNLLAASQLHAQALDPAGGLDEDEVRVAARRIASASALSGSLLAQLRPLFSPGAGSRRRCRPADVLEDLGRACDGVASRALRVRSAAAAGLPDVAFDAELLRQLLLASVLVGDDESAAGEDLRVSAAVDGEFVAFVVERTPGPSDADAAHTLCGTALVWALARAILAERGGRLDLPTGSGRARVELRVPLQPVDRGGASG